MGSLSIYIRKILKSNHHSENIFRFLMRPYFALGYAKSSLGAWLRKKGFSNPQKYQYLKKMKNSHKGERCFIIATGPSLTFEDLNLLRNEYTIGMNSGVYAIDKTMWVPNLLGLEDEYVYQKLEPELIKQSEGKLKDRILVSNVIAKYFKSARRFHVFPVNLLDHKCDFRKIGKLKFSDDCYSIVYDAYSITFSLMQIAIYMGFKEIYLVGCDCTYNKAKAHFIETGVVDPYASQLGERFIYVHSKLKEFADSKGIKIFNCTRGGMLDVYPRKKIEEVISNCSQG